MGMYATSANELKVEFGQNRSVTFKMHADIGIDLVRWLSDQLNRIKLVGKRADKLERTAIDLSEDDTGRFTKLTDDAAELRKKGDEAQMCVEYIKKASNGWIDFYEDEAAEQRQELLPFTEANIARLGAANLIKVINTFNAHYGLVRDEQPGEAKGEASSEPSPSEAKVLTITPNGISSSAPIVP